jgi:hypothetical protein
MTAAIKLKKSAVTGKKPVTGDIDYGEMAINYADGRLFYKNSSNVIKNFIDSDLIVSRISNIESAFTKSLVTFEYKSTASQITFANSDQNGSVLSYLPDNVIVSLNGVILRPGDDYTATSGTSIVLDSAADLNDVLQVTTFKSFGITDAVRASTGGTFNGSVTVNGTMSATTFSGAGTSLTGISSTNLASPQSIIIYNSAGTALKTLYGAGS